MEFLSTIAKISTYCFFAWPWLRAAREAGFLKERSLEEYAIVLGHSAEALRNADAMAAAIVADVAPPNAPGRAFLKHAGRARGWGPP